MKQKFLVSAVIVLLLLNTAMIVFMWMNRPGKQAPRPQGPVKAFLKKELSLTVQQEVQFEEERKKHFDAMRPLHEAAMEKRNELFDQISTADSNSNRIEALSAELTAAESKKEVMTVNHFRKLRTLLNKEQQSKFDKIFKDVLRMMSGAGGQRGGPPPHDRPGPPPEDQPPHDPENERRPDTLHQ